MFKWLIAKHHVPYDGCWDELNSFVVELDDAGQVTWVTPVFWVTQWKTIDRHVMSGQRAEQLIADGESGCFDFVELVAIDDFERLAEIFDYYMTAAAVRHFRLMARSDNEYIHDPGFRWTCFECGEWFDAQDEYYGPYPGDWRGDGHGIAILVDHCICADCVPTDDYSEEVDDDDEELE